MTKYIFITEGIKNLKELNPELNNSKAKGH